VGGPPNARTCIVCYLSATVRRPTGHCSDIPGASTRPTSLHGIVIMTLGSRVLLSDVLFDTIAKPSNVSIVRCRGPCHGLPILDR